MRAVTSRGGQVEVVEVDEPDDDARRQRSDAHGAHGEQAVLEVTSSGICASDLHLVAFGMSGMTLGHEFGGHLPDGTLVAVRPTGACGSCRSCLGARPQVCRDATATMYGTALPGGLAERVLVELDRVVPIAPGVDPRDVALVEPLAVAIHGIHRADVRPGDRIVIIGGGSIGLFTAAALRHRGVEVDLVARHPHQRDAAQALGASTDVDPSGSGIGPDDGYDVVIDAVSTQESTDQALTLCRPGGTLLELGMFWQPVSFGNRLLLKEISVVPSIFYAHGHDHSDVAEAADLLAAWPGLARIVVTHRYPLERAVDAFAAAGDRASGAIKVHLHP